MVQVWGYDDTYAYDISDIRLTFFKPSKIIRPPKGLGAVV